MPTFSSYDGTLLAYRTIGDGEPLICLPGGPMQDSVYLGDLGGLSAYRRLIVLDSRGTGSSAVPADPTSYRCDRQVGDVEALRAHLGLDAIDLLGHSASVNLATLYAARHPEKVRRLVLIGPSGGAVGITITGEMRRSTALLRKDEPWFADAFAALERVTTGNGGDADWAAIAPFFAGRWDAAAQEHHAAADSQINMAAAGEFVSDGVFTPDATRTALAGLGAQVLLLGGEFDINSPPAAVAEFAAIFPHATHVVQPGAGHQPWMDDAAWFAARVAAFLG